MKILVLSDSHSALRFMRDAIRIIKPDAVIHLGDYYDDAQALREENPHIVFHTVPGNCDRYRCAPDVPQTLCYCIGGVKLYMTHGHLHGVKSGIYRLLLDARRQKAQAALYGHTHEADCHLEEDGLWVLNPGSCGHAGGSVGILETDNNTITACRVLRQADLEEYK